MSKVDDYAQQLKQLLPESDVLRQDVNSVLHKLMLAISEELARVDDRSDVLMTEADPRTATETLADWERALQLPDNRVLAIPGTTAGRRSAVTQKYTDRGGQSESFFIALAAACGYTATIYRYSSRLCRTGVARTGDVNTARLVGEVAAYTFQLNVTLPAAAGALSQADFERVITYAAHAHVTVVFVYT